LAAHLSTTEFFFISAQLLQAFGHSGYPSFDGVFLLWRAADAFAAQKVPVAFAAMLANDSRRLQLPWL